MAGGNANWHCAKLHVAGTFAPDGRGPAKAWLLKITSIFRITFSNSTYFVPKKLFLTCKENLQQQLCVLCNKFMIKRGLA